jgi:hypothetical protein
MPQFVTLDYAKALALQLNAIGGGVKPITVDPNTSGIYIPQYGGPYETPVGADASLKFYHFRFRNGAEGINAGLVDNLMHVFPTRWPAMLAADVSYVPPQFS